MAQILNLDEVRRLARLAKLQLTDEEAVKYQKQMSDIFEYFELLDSIDTTGLSPTSQVTGLTNVVRDDEVRSQAAAVKDLVALAPNRDNEYIKVKRVI